MCSAFQGYNHSLASTGRNGNTGKASIVSYRVCEIGVLRLGACYKSDGENHGAMAALQVHQGRVHAFIKAPQDESAGRGGSAEISRT
jgi:hypothetical protein